MALTKLQSQMLQNPSGGVKNYISSITTSNGANTLDGTFESASVSAWTLGNVTLTNNFPSGTPTFGSGYNSNQILSIVSGGQIAGTYCMGYANIVNDFTAGDFVSTNAFYIDNEDQAKVLGFSVAYTVFSGAANLNFSGTSSNTLGVAFYDVTNSTWIQPAGVFNFVQSSGIGLCTGTFQTSRTGTQYRMLIYNANASTGTATMYFDDISVGPQITASGAAISDWVPYTPTFVGLGTVSSISIFSKREGDSLLVRGFFETGTVSSSTASMTLGYNGVNSNVTLDTTKIGDTGVAGFMTLGASSSTLFSASVISNSTSTGLVNFGIQTSTTNAETVALGTAFSSTAFYTVNFTVPIVGWSSNTVMSADTDTRVVAARAFLNTTTSFTSGITTLIPFNAISYDTHGAFNTSNSSYVIPVTGYYDIGISAYTNSDSSTSAWIFSYETNGVTGGYFGGANTLLNRLSGSTQDFFTAGQVVTFFVIQNSGSTLEMNASSTGSYVFISRRSGPATIAASESVNATYNNTGNQSIPNNTVTAVTSGWNKEFDSHDVFNNGVYTIPSPGKYRVTLQFSYSGAITPSSGTFISANIYHNGTQYTRSLSYNVSTYTSTSVTRTLSCLAGDTVGLYTEQNTGGSIGLNVDASLCYFSIERIGN